ncbi:bacterial lipid a biosynthesis acyltransferase [Lucifera butyrica]|uniref:Bacterial lipid a biosynthesis acyltransferase n=1 Tax=Lucifera butyrica TaxID=1351585 RepID=A0A498RDV7_9FIRM|nr:lysophospholipid acyltransferase family protein [Lucifera butyrica]VBB09509.1 bacterial lipid a biosynthesis acyltransferase [Lucifera butyrica]
MLTNFRYYLLKILSAGICLLPHSLVFRIGRSLGYLFYLVAVRQRNRGINQAMNGLEISYEEAKEVVKRVCYNLGQTFIEILYIPKLTRENFSRYISIEGLENLQQAIESGRGVVFLTAHIGNWEWLAVALSLAGFPVTAIAQPQPNDQYNRFLKEYREMKGNTIFYRGTNEIIKAARALKKGKVLGFLADQDGGPNGLFVNFLGKEASTPIGPAFFAEKFEAVVVPGFIFHSSRGKHHIVIQPPLVYGQCDNPDQDLSESTLQMTKVIEDVIRQHPEEWLWFQKRWNTPYTNCNS